MPEPTTCPHPEASTSRRYDWPIGGRVLHMRTCTACGSDVSTGQTFLNVVVKYADAAEETETLDWVLVHYAVTEEELKSLRAGDSVALGHGVSIELAKVSS